MRLVAVHERLEGPAEQAAAERLGLLRELAPRVLGGLMRRYGYFDE